MLYPSLFLFLALSVSLVLSLSLSLPLSCISGAMEVVGGCLSRLSQGHGIKLGVRSPHTVEEVALAVEEVVRPQRSMKSAA